MDTLTVRIGSRPEVGHGHGHGHGSDVLLSVAVAVAVADPPVNRSRDRLCTKTA
jgi:hypothetical protein